LLRVFALGFALAFAGFFAALAGLATLPDLLRLPSTERPPASIMLA
jgi:hypothetical protein